MVYSLSRFNQNLGFQWMANIQFVHQNKPSKSDACGSSQVKCTAVLRRIKTQTLFDLVNDIKVDDKK